MGRYTAGAISSIAFGIKSPVLDGNVIRVLTRLKAIGSDIGRPQTIKKLWGLAGTLMPDESPGDYNQALMELGATVCHPENPKCFACPVSQYCSAYKNGSPNRYPVKKQKEKIEKIRNIALILKKNGQVLLKRQPYADRWGGLWIFPFWKNAQAMFKDTGYCAHDLKKRMTITHGFTKYRINLEVFEKAERTGTYPLKGRWVKLTNLKKLAFPSPHKKIAASLVSSSRDLTPLGHLPVAWNHGQVLLRKPRASPGHPPL